MPRRKTHEEFANEVYALVEGEYEVLGEYKNIKTKINLLHKSCGRNFHQTPEHFLRGNRCPHCFGTIKKDIEQFKSEVFNLVGDEYEVLGDYISCNTKIKLFHNKCGNDYHVSPYNFISGGNRCPICSGYTKKTTDQFKQEVFELEGNNYTVLSEYINSKSNILMEHSVCGNQWETIPSRFLRGDRCPKCKESKGEKQISIILNKNEINYVPQFKIEECRNILPLPFDFAIFDKNNKLLCLIEYDGEGHFKPFTFIKDKKKRIKNLKDTQKRDKIKDKYCKDNNIPLLRIPYWEFDNIGEILIDYINELNNSLLKECLILDAPFLYKQN